MRELQAVAEADLPAGLRAIVKTATAAGWWTTATAVTYPSTRRKRETHVDSETGKTVGIMVPTEYDATNVQVKGWAAGRWFVVQYQDGKPGCCYCWASGDQPQPRSVTELKARINEGKVL